MEEGEENISEQNGYQEVVEVKQPQSVLVSEEPVAAEIVSTEVQPTAKDNQKRIEAKEGKTEASPKVEKQVSPKEMPKAKTSTEIKEKGITPPPSAKTGGEGEITAVTSKTTTAPKETQAEPVTNVRGIASGPKVSGMAAVMNHEEYDFGNIKEGAKVKHTFVLKNIGTQDLFIQDVDAGCSCTTADYSFEAIRPGGSTPIEVTFNSDTKVGTQLKKISIATNAGTKVVKMTGTVFPKDKKY